MGWNNTIFQLLIVTSTSGTPTGFFFYNGAPARGNLVLAITAPGVTTDPFGDSIPSSGVFNAGTWNAAGTLLQHFGINNAGDFFLANSSGLVVIHGHSATGGQWFYDTAGESFGHLSISISPAADTDTSGNPVKAGLASYDNVFGGSAQLNGATLSLFTAAALVASASPSGFQTFGAANLVGQLIAGVLQFFNSASTAQTVNSNVTGIPGSATTGSAITLDSGRGAAGATDAIVQAQSSDFGSNTVATVQITAGIIALSSFAKISTDNWHTVGAISQPPFVNSFSAGGTAPRFQYEPIGGGRVRLSGAVNTGAVTAANTTIFTLPAGYVPSRAFSFATPNNVTAYVLGGSSIGVTTGGAVQLVPAGTAGKFVLLDGICFELD